MPPPTMLNRINHKQRSLLFAAFAHYLTHHVRNNVDWVVEFLIIIQGYPFYCDHHDEIYTIKLQMIKIFTLIWFGAVAY